MMRIGDVRDAVLRAQLRRAGVRLQVAGLSINLRTDVMAAARLFLEMYRGHRIEPGPGVDDFRVFLTYTGPLRRFLRRRTQIHIDGAAAFEPPPYRHAYLAIESALNACISATATHAVVHAAMVERDGVGTILPAPSGSGKSTLCAALVTRGWRLLSDELTVLSPPDFRLQPVARPISLKNQSIDIIRRWAPDAYLSPVFTGTIRGDIAYLRPPADSVARAAETVAPALIVSPLYVAGAPPTLEPLARSEAFRLLADQGINYHPTHRSGFDATVGLVESCAAYRLRFGTLAGAVDAIEALVVRTRAERASGRIAVA